MEKKPTGRLDVPIVTPQISLDELTKDLSAFLHFLSENYDGETGTELPSFWMLIPNSIDVEYRYGTKDFYLEKEIFSRRIRIIAEPPPDHFTDQERRESKAELLCLFQNAISGDQTHQILTLLSSLRPDARTQILDNFKKYKNERGIK